MESFITISQNLIPMWVEELIYFFNSFLPFITMETIKQSIRNKIYNVNDVDLSGQSAVIEIAAGNTPVITQLYGVNERLIAVDIKKPSQKKLRNHVSIDYINFQYLWGEGYLEKLSTLNEIKSIFISFPNPTKDTIVWLLALFKTLKKNKAETSINLFTEIQPVQNEWSTTYFSLKYDFYKILKGVLTQLGLDYDVNELTFEDFHKDYCETENSLMLSQSLMIRRQGVAVFSIKIY